MDVDTTSRKGAHEKLLTDFENGKGDILLGTDDCQRIRLSKHHACWGAQCRYHAQFT